MPPSGKAPRKEELELQCEWGSCSYVCWAMEEFFEHLQQHLQQHLRSSAGEDEDDLLGKGQPWEPERGPFCQVLGEAEDASLVLMWPVCGAFLVCETIVALLTTGTSSSPPQMLFLV